MIQRLLIVLLALVVVPWQSARVLPVSAAAPTLDVSPAVVPLGDRITVTGSGYDAGKTITVSVNTTPTALSQSVPVPPSGSITTTFEIPIDTQPGSYTVTASLNGVILATKSFQVLKAEITAAPNPASPGTLVVVTGTGFSSGVTVVVRVGISTGTSGNQTVQENATADSSGGFSATLSLPADTLPGSYTVHAILGGNDLAQVALNVVAGPIITVQPATQATSSAATITVSGSGFASGEQVHIQYAATNATGAAVTEEVTGAANGSGSFTVTNIPVPSTISPGTYTVTATGLTSGKSATGQFSVSASPALNISPLSASPGATITISGLYFAPNTQVTVSATVPQVDNTVLTPTAAATTDSQGRFTATIQIPSGSASGTVLIRAIQNGSMVGTGASLTIGVLTPAIAVTPGSVLPGSAVVVSGKGFGPGPGYPITLSGQMVVGGALQTISQTVNPDGAGNFTAVVTVPGNAAAGTITLFASQESAGVVARTTLTIQAPTPTPTSSPTVTPTATATPLPSPTVTNTPIVTVTPAPPRNRALRFKSVSLWYHTVRVGTYDRLVVVASQKSKVSIWVHVLFPNAKHFDYYERTSARGRWSKQFPIPRDALTAGSDVAHVELQLLTGSLQTKTFLTFTIVR